MLRLDANCVFSDQVASNRNISDRLLYTFFNRCHGNGGPGWYWLQSSPVVYSISKRHSLTNRRASIGRIIDAIDAGNWSPMIRAALPSLSFCLSVSPSLSSSHRHTHTHTPLFRCNLCSAKQANNSGSGLEGEGWRVPSSDKSCFTQAIQRKMKMSALSTEQ